MTPSIALLGEVEENPLVRGLDALREDLARVLAELNRDHAEYFRVPLVATSAFPEFAAVLSDVGRAYPLTRRLAETLHPLAVRIAVAQGDLDLSVPAGSEPPDGPAFDQAGELLYRARKEGRMLLVAGGTPGMDTLANAVFLILGQELRRWTPRQCEVVRLYRKLNRQQDVARELGVSQQSVSSALAAAGWRTLSGVEEALAQALEGYAASPALSEADLAARIGAAGSRWKEGA